MSTFRYWAVAGSFVFHAVALGWLVYQPAGSLSLQADPPVVQALTVMQISSRPDQSIPVRPVITQNEVVNHFKSQTRAPVAPSAQSPDVKSPGLIPDYYPAKELSKMPFAFTDMDTLLPTALNGLERGAMHIRLWLNQSGNVDRSLMLKSELPTEIENAVLASLRNMRFKPGEINDIPVKVWVDIVVEYGENVGMDNVHPMDVKTVSPIQSSQ